MAETFLKTLKAELIRRNRWETRRQAEGPIFQNVNGFDNPRRRHSVLGGKSPWPSNEMPLTALYHFQDINSARLTTI